MDYLGTATYSPEDNKLRMYPFCRLDPETYATLKKSGFAWAPKQELFVAPMWTPGREDLLLRLCGEIEDEDKSLVERAEEREERFATYSEHRTADAESAYKTASAISDSIPFGQPILIGHHSERRHRAMLEKMHNNMGKAVKMWDTAEYWKSRAASAISHAKYKERPDVRARRIKKLESQKRSYERQKSDREKALKLWNKAFTREEGLSVANFFNFDVVKNTESGFDWSAFSVLQPDDERNKSCPSLTVEQVKEKANNYYPRSIAYAERWIAHYENRLVYERAMYSDGKGVPADNGLEVGGAIKYWGYNRQWAPILKVNKVSVKTVDNYCNGGADFTRNISFDQIKAVLSKADYEKITIS